MNILVIGNGFDLEHGLPTTYWDFLMFIKMTKKYKSWIEIKDNDGFGKLHINLQKLFKDEKYIENYSKKRRKNF